MDDSSNIQVSAKPAQRLQVSATGTTTARCDRLTPATLKQGKAELGACLTLVSPSGLTAEDRKEWLAVAMQTLSGIPADLLSYGCAEARKRCRFPSEIVPTVMDTVKSSWDHRKRMNALDRAEWENRNAPRIAKQPPEYIDPKLLTELREKLERQFQA